MRPTRVILGGASRGIRNHVAALLRSLPFDVEVVGEAPTSAGVAILARRLRPHVVVLFEDSTGAASAAAPLVVLVPSRPVAAPRGVVVLPLSQHTLQSVVLQIGKMLDARSVQRPATSRGSGNATSSSTTRTSSTTAGP